MGQSLVVFLLLSSQLASADYPLAAPSPAPTTADPASLESPFKDVHPKWLVQTVLEFPFYSFYLGAPAIRGVAYLPNFAPRLGPRVVYRDFGATVTLSLPIPEREKERRGDSTQQNFIFNSYWRRYAYDVFYQRIRGFYVNSPFTELSVHKPDRYPQLPDTRVLNVGFNGYYVVNPQRYSLRAAFDQDEFQTQSGGSWILNPFFTHFEMGLGKKLILGSNPETLPELPNIASGRFRTLGVAGGFGYTYIRSKFFATGQATWGPGFQFQEIDRSDGNDSKVTSLAAKLNVNASAGWNHVDYVGGVKVLVDSIWARVVDTQLSSSLVSVQLFFGHRF